MGQRLDALLAQLNQPPAGRGILESVKEFAPVKLARAGFGAAQSVGGGIAGAFAPDAYQAALEENLRRNQITPDTSNLDILAKQTLPGLGDVLHHSLPQGVQENSVYRVLGEPVTRLGGNILGDPTNVATMAGKIPIAAARGLGAAATAAFAPDVLEGIGGGISQARAGFEAGDTVGALQGVVGGTLAAGLGALMVKGHWDEYHAKKAEIQKQADAGSVEAHKSLEELDSLEESIMGAYNQAPAEPALRGQAAGQATPGVRYGADTADFAEAQGVAAPEVAPGDALRARRDVAYRQQATENLAQEGQQKKANFLRQQEQARQGAQESAEASSLSYITGEQDRQAALEARQAEDTDLRFMGERAAEEDMLHNAQQYAQQRAEARMLPQAEAFAGARARDRQQASDADVMFMGEKAAEEDMLTNAQRYAQDQQDAKMLPKAEAFAMETARTSRQAEDADLMFMGERAAEEDMLANAQRFAAEGKASRERTQAWRDSVEGAEGQFSPDKSIGRTGGQRASVTTDADIRQHAADLRAHAQSIREALPQTIVGDREERAAYVDSIANAFGKLVIGDDAGLTKATKPNAERSGKPAKATASELSALEESQLLRYLDALPEGRGKKLYDQVTALRAKRAAAGKPENTRPYLNPEERGGTALLNAGERFSPEEIAAQMEGQRDLEGRYPARPATTKQVETKQPRMLYNEAKGESFPVSPAGDKPGTVTREPIMARAGQTSVKKAIPEENELARDLWQAGSKIEGIQTDQHEMATATGQQSVDSNPRRTVGDAYAESVANFVEGAAEKYPAELAAWNAGDKDPLRNKFKREMQATIRVRTHKAAGKAPKVGTEEQTGLAVEKGQQNAPEPELSTIEGSLQEKMQHGGNLEERLGQNLKEADFNESSLNDIIVKEKLLDLEMRNNSGSKVTHETKEKAWKTYLIKKKLEEGGETITVRELAENPGYLKAIGAEKPVSPGTISKYLSSVEKALGTEEGVGKTLGDISKSLEGKVPKGVKIIKKSNGVEVTLPSGEAFTIRVNAEGILFPNRTDVSDAPRLKGQGTATQALSEEGLHTVVAYAFANWHGVSGVLDLSGVKRAAVDDFAKAGFIKPVQGEFVGGSPTHWEIQPKKLAYMQGGLGFIPPPALARVMHDIGSAGYEAVHYGASLIKRGIVEVGGWVARMTSRFGDSIKTHLRGLYNELRAAARSFSFGELKDEPQGPVVGSMGGVLQDFFKRKQEQPGAPKAPATFEEFKGKIVAAAEKAAANPEAVPPGHPEGRLPKEAGGGKAENVAYNTYRAVLPKEVDAPTVAIMKILNPYLSRSKTLTMKKVQREAGKLLGENPDMLTAFVNKYIPGVPEAEMTAMRKAANILHERRANAMAEAQARGTAEAKQAAYDAILHSAVAGAIVGEDGSMAARLLRMRGIKLSDVDPSKYHSDKFVDALRDLPGIDKNAARALYGFWVNGNYDAFRKGILDAMNPGPKEFGAEIWKSTLFTPASWVVNGASGLSVVAAGGYERRGAALYDNIRVRLFGGEREIYAVPMGVMHGIHMNSMRKAMPLFMDDAFSILKAEPLKVRNVTQLKRATSALPATPFYEFLKSNFKIMDAVDQISASISMGRNAGIFAWTEAMKDVKGNKAEAKKIFGEYLQEFEGYAAAKLGPADPDFKPTRWNGDRLKEKFERTVKLMEEDTFKEDLNGAVRSFGHAIHESAVGTAIVPFYQTPVNIAKEILRRTPMGLLLMHRKVKRGMAELKPEWKGRSYVDQYKEAMRGISHEEWATDVSKMVTGTLMGGLVWSALDDNLTGGGPSDPRKREQLKLTGWQPYSIRAGDTYYSYQRLDPFSSILGMAADISAGFKYHEFDKVGTATQRLAATLTENLTNKTFMSGLEGFFTMWSDPAQYAGRWIKQMEGSAVPNTIGWLPFGSLAKAIDPVFRQTEAGTLQPLQAKIPFLSQSLEPQLGPAGEERQRGENFLSRLASPIRMQTAVDSPKARVAEEAGRVGYVMNSPKRYFNYGDRKVEYTRPEMAEFQKAQAGAIARVNNLLHDPSYTRLPDDEEDPNWKFGQKTKADVIREIFQKFRMGAMKKVRGDVLARGRAESKS